MRLGSVEHITQPADYKR